MKSVLNLILFTILILSYETQLVLSSSCTKQEVKAQIEMCELYVDRINHDRDFYLNVTETYYTNETVLNIIGFGTFSGKTIAIEYGELFFVGLFGGPPLTKSYNYPALSIECKGTLENGTVCKIEHVTINYFNQQTLSNGTIIFDLIVGGSYTTTWLTLEGCSPNILRDDSQPSDEVIAYSVNSTKSINTAVTCLIIELACTGDLQQYENQTDCIDYLDSKHSASPTPFSADNPFCRQLHAIIASGIDPQIHCPHTGKESVTCVDTDLPACDSCGVNNTNHAACNANYPTHQEPVYFCECNPGYVGNGSKCIPVPCSSTGKGCGTYGQCQQGSSLCGCLPGFDWDGFTGKCICQDGFRITKAPNGTSICIPPYACISKKECPQQDREHVVCGQPDPSNPLVPYDFCLCKDGYSGGWSTPCTCKSPNKSFYSKKDKTQVCLAPGQCLTDNQCGWWQSCSTPMSGSSIGICDPS